MSSIIQIEGGNPLIGTIKISGSKISALKLIAASLLTNEDVILDNVPRVTDIENDLTTIAALGGKFEWVGKNRLLINGSSINSFEIPYESGSKYRTAALLAGPLVYRFGKAIVPKPLNTDLGERPINRLVETWKAFGMEILEDDTHYIIRGDNLKAANINFSTGTHLGTDNAIICAAFMSGETTIINAAEEPEVDDLIALMNVLGAEVSRTEQRTIKVKGTNIFKGGVSQVQNDRHEAVAHIVGALVTNGNITLKGVKREHLVAFTNVLTKMDANYEFSSDELRVWGDKTSEYKAVDITTAPAPGFMASWKALVTLLLTRASGVSQVHDTVYINRFSFARELNRMGAKITLHKPSEVGLEAVISDDGYDVSAKGEPVTVAKITGPTTLKGIKTHIPDLTAGVTIVLAALAAEGKAEISGLENIERGYENFLEKLETLGAEFEVVN